MKSAILLLPFLFTAAAFADECTNWQTEHPAWLFCDDFESGSLGSWEDVTDITIASGTGKKHNGTYSAQLFYPNGSEGAGWMWKKALRPDNANNDAQYVRWWQRWEPGFEWNNGPSGDQKLFMLQALEPQSGWGQTASWKIYVHLVGQEHSGQGVLLNEPYFDRFIWSGGSQWDGQWMGMQQNSTVYRYQTDKWECTEIEVVHNTPGSSDGRVRVWLNDVLAMDRNNIKLRDEAVSWNALQLNGWYGSPGVPKNQYSWVDQVVVSTERIGCSHAQSSPKNVQVVP
ncbi:MAG: hypothetical protein KDD66_04350 [Bdellovibrionales bacterium]|nr:hypothetical protein [Bdellovibrionales bacterium]